MKAERRRGEESESCFPLLLLLCVSLPPHFYSTSRSAPSVFFHASQSVVVLIGTIFVRALLRPHLSFYVSWRRKWKLKNHLKSSPQSHEQILFLFLFFLERRKSKGGNGADQKHPTTTGRHAHTEQQKPPQLFSLPPFHYNKTHFSPSFLLPWPCVWMCWSFISVGRWKKEGRQLFSTMDTRL